MRTGMEPFFEFIGAVIFAVQQIRIEWRNAREYRKGL
jgi:hypothetical protein